MEPSSTTIEQEKHIPVAESEEAHAAEHADASQEFANRGIEMSVNALLARTVLRKLPAPLNVVVPLAVQKAIIEYGVPEGREILLKGLRWVKKVTDEKPEQQQT